MVGHQSAGSFGGESARSVHTIRQPMQQFPPGVQGSNATMQASGNRGAFQLDLAALNRNVQPIAEEQESQAEPNPVSAFGDGGLPAHLRDPNFQQEPDNDDG